MADAAGSAKRKREADDHDGTPEAGQAGAAPGTSTTEATNQDGGPAVEPGDELATLLEEVSALTPTIPEAAIQFYLMKNGFSTTDDRVVKMVALATQKFVSDVATDALQHCKQRQAGAPANRRATAKDKRFVLTMPDLQAALKDQGIGMMKPPYYV